MQSSPAGLCASPPASGGGGPAWRRQTPDGRGIPGENKNQPRGVSHPGGTCPSPVWDVNCHHHLEWKKPMPFVNNYSFHIVDRDWGHVTIKLSGHPPFPAQIILNGHDYVACQARTTVLAFSMFPGQEKAGKDPFSVSIFHLSDRVQPESGVH